MNKSASAMRFRKSGSSQILCRRSNQTTPSHFLRRLPSLRVAVTVRNHTFIVPKVTAASQNRSILCNLQSRKPNNCLFANQKNMGVVVKACERVQRRSFASPISVPPSQQLSVAMVTPRSLARGRLGGIVARLLTQPDLNLVGARMMAPSDDFRKEYIDILTKHASADGVIDPYEKACINFVQNSLDQKRAEAKGHNNRTLWLLFSGKDTLNTLNRTVGSNVPGPEDAGRTIRSTYGDYQKAPSGEIIDFHPAVMCPSNAQENREILALFARYARVLPPIFKPLTPNAKLETGLVMIKPDNLARPSALPGHIIDLFGTTGMHIVGARVFSMTLNDGYEFYGFLEKVFVNKLAGKVKNRLRDRLTGAFDFPLTEDDLVAMTDPLKEKNARTEVAKIITYMTGLNPLSDPPPPRDQPGPAKCFALLYRGVNAIEILRNKLGSTNPNEAAPGTIRSDYGHDLMQNGAHCSDSVESCERERKIVGLVGNEPSAEADVIEQWLRETGKYE